ncbi:hypothetical protein GHT06_007847 [Daphnia sinensis]|uniref:Uncharacterized protein n=1 Tax=Daphnia sinensis TaxID=1820382 RepID=A0AAD5L082_9CRUS|nr:hypothetical protein GHT06_007847 [Daphnia sinensis]
MSLSNETANSAEEKSSASVFLWKAAVSTIDFHPAITANLLLRCKRALNDTKVGVKFRKISKSNICQSCGNPWSLGNYKLEIRKTFKAAKIKNFLKKSKNQKKINNFNKHILERFSERKSNLIIRCHCCLKPTAFPTPLPPREPKPEKKLLSQKTNMENKNHKKDKPTIQHINPGKKQDKQQVNKNNMKACKVMKTSSKQQFSKSHLKNLSKTLTKGSSAKSSLQSFLSSVK